MNAIPLINNAPRPNINVGSIGSPAFNPVAAGAKLGGSIGGNVMRQNPASMPVNNETQLRQEVNTSIVALKREAFSLENLIAQAAQTLQDINKRLSELEGKQGDYVKKADATVASVGGDGKYISAISETDGKINATATDLGNMVPVNSVTSGNMHSVTSNAVAEYVDRLIYSQSVACEAYDPNTMPSVIASVTLPEDNTVRYMVTATLGYNNSNPEFLALLHTNGIFNDIVTKNSKYGDFTITTNMGQIAALKVSAIYSGGVTVKVRGASKVDSNNTVNIYIRKIIR